MKFRHKIQQKDIYINLGKEDLEEVKEQEQEDLKNIFRLYE
jgi:hypothetical protein